MRLKFAKVERVSCRQVLVVRGKYNRGPWRSAAHYNTLHSYTSQNIGGNTYETQIYLRAMYITTRMSASTQTANTPSNHRM